MTSHSDSFDSRYEFTLDYEPDPDFDEDEDEDDYQDCTDGWCPSCGWDEPERYSNLPLLHCPQCGWNWDNPS